MFFYIIILKNVPRASAKFFVLFHFLLQATSFSTYCHEEWRIEVVYAQTNSKHSDQHSAHLVQSHLPFASPRVRELIICSGFHSPGAYGERAVNKNVFVVEVE